MTSVDLLSYIFSQKMIWPFIVQSKRSPGYFKARPRRSQSGFFADFYFWKILEQTKAGLWALRCHDGRSHALLNCLCLAAIVWHAVCSRHRKWIFPQISCAFVRDSGAPNSIFEAPERRRKICGKSALKYAHCAQKICAKICAQNLRKKSAQKSAHKSAHQNQCK